VNSFVIFVAVCLAIALGGWLVSKRTGSRSWFLDAWPFDADEPVLWRDDRADIVVVPRLGQAASMRPLRLHRWAAVLTKRRIVIATKSFSGRHVVMYVLEFGAGADAQTGRLDGGLFSRGYTTLRVQREPVLGPPDRSGKPVYIAFRPVAGANSSFNMSELRIYTDAPGTMPAP
jgi:hypothetical protein